MHLKDTLQELENDFCEVFEKVDFKNYNPSSEQIKSLINIGLVWFLTDRIKHDEEKQLKHVKDHICDELESAEEYYEKWLETKDYTLKQMVKDELKHADYFIKQSRMLVKDVEQQAKLQKYINWYNNILNKLD